VVLEWTTRSFTSVRGITVIPLYVLSKPTHTAFVLLWHELGRADVAGL
jgi:hypothetical protein